MSLKLLRLRTTGQCHFLPLLQLVPVLLLLPPSPPTSAAASTVVTHLPGFNGPLPFNLETGYMGVEEETGAELFYYFVESERSPGTDPVILWLTGGPRCSVIMGPLKFVLAPYSGGLPELVYNPYSWTKMANILLLDSPVGSDFSYARDPKGYDVGDYSSSSQVQTFLNKWFTDHPQYLSNPFYIGGDSYVGKVIPLIAQGISEDMVADSSDTQEVDDLVQRISLKRAEACFTKSGSDPHLPFPAVCGVIDGNDTAGILSLDSLSKMSLGIEGWIAGLLPLDRCTPPNSSEKSCKHSSLPSPATPLELPLTPVQPFKRIKWGCANQARQKKAGVVPMGE